MWRQAFFLGRSGSQSVHSDVLDIVGQCDARIHSTGCHRDPVSLVHPFDDLQKMVGSTAAVANAIREEEKMHGCSLSHPKHEGAGRRWAPWLGLDCLSVGSAPNHASQPGG